MIDPGVHAELGSLGVAVTPVGAATSVPYEGTTKIKLPIKEITDTAVEHRGGFRLEAGDADLVVRKVTIPEAGLVTAKVKGSAVGDLGRVSLLFQAASGSPLGDTSLSFTFTFASCVNQTFGSSFLELGTFAFSTTHPDGT